MNSKSGDAKSYFVQASNVGVQPPILNGSRGIVNNSILDIVTKTASTLSPPFVGANYFWVTPVNAFGFGNSSAVVFYNNPGKI